MKERVVTFSAAAIAILDAIPVDPDATYAYEHFSGGFVWSDEFPVISSPDWTIVSHDYLYRYLIQCRRRITLGIAASELLPLWQQVVGQAPNWPGLLPERRSGRIVGRLRAAERLAERCYEKTEAEWLEGDGDPSVDPSGA